MKLVQRLLSGILFVALMIPASFAVSFDNNGTPSGFNRFHPISGTLTATFSASPAVATTVINFKYTNAVVTNIKNYNANGKYTGIDIKDQSNFSFDAYSITTTAPNVKTDIEANFGLYNNEAEIVIFGTLTANQNYSMTVKWRDVRGGFGGNTNNFVVHSELSEKVFFGLLDYNVVQNGHVGLATLAFGNYMGRP